jgi:RNA recognition motif-containing protein
MRRSRWLANAGKKEPEMSTKIYVGNLPFSATESEVRELFEAHGTVETVSIVEDRDTGRPRGFGFVEMADARAAQAAIAALAGASLGGRNLNVNEARPRTERSGSGSGRRW